MSNGKGRNAAVAALLLAGTLFLGVGVSHAQVAPSVNGSTSEADPGTTVPISAALVTDGTSTVVGLQNDLTFAVPDAVIPDQSRLCCTNNQLEDCQDPSSCTSNADCTTAPWAVCASAGPACTVDPAIKKANTTFGFLPASPDVLICCTDATRSDCESPERSCKTNGDADCTVAPFNTCAHTQKCSDEGHGPCTGVRAIVFAQDSLNAKKPIPSGSTLYTCDVSVSQSATAQYPMVISNVITSDKDGKRVCGPAQIVGPGTPTPAPIPECLSQNGSVNIAGAVTGTPTVTATPTETVGEVTATPTETVEVPTATATFVPTATKTATAVPTTTPTAARRLLEEDGCNLNASTTSSSGWFLLIPALGLIVLRRRWQ